MSPLLFIGPALALVAASAVVRSQRRRRQTADRLRREWGTARAAGTRDEHADEFLRVVNDNDMSAAALNARTWSDLDLDDVLRYIDRTQTTIGRQILHARLRQVSSAPHSGRVERLATRFGADRAVRERAQAALAEIDPTTGQGYWRITRPGAIRTEWWYYSFPFLTLGLIASLIAMPFWPKALLVLLALGLINAFVRAATSRQTIGLLGAYRQVGPVLSTATRLVEIGDVHALADGDVVAADLRHLAGLQRIASWVSRDPIAVGELVATLFEYLNLALLLDANALLFGARALERHRDALLRTSVWMGEVDIALTIASLRAESRPWCVPTRTDAGSTTDIVDAWHPMLRDAVPNSVTLRGGEGMILTGSNMSGKSTFLRTVGVCIVLADALGICPARSYAGPVVRVRTCIGRTDDLASGKSYYLAEVEAVLEILRASDEPMPHVFLFDELFRGTNTIERLAAGEAVLSALMQSGAGGARHAVIVATHDGELVSMLRGAYTPMHFQETIGADGLSFDYKLLSGPATTRSAIALLELKGAPRALLDRARARAAELDKA